MLEQPSIDVEGLITHLSAQPDVVASYLFGSVAREGFRMPDDNSDVLALLSAEDVIPARCCSLNSCTWLD